MTRIGRRGFVKAAAGAALGAGLASTAHGLPRTAAADELPMPKRRLGKIGYQTSIFSLGGLLPDERDEAAAIVNRALDLGVNYIDTAASYSDGVSEANIGSVMRDRRDEVFLATKTRVQTDDGIEHEAFEKSCENLQTDYLDLYFLHAVHTMEHLDTVMDRETGAIRAFERLREKGRIGNIGISSHTSAVLIEAINRYDFDCVFVTLNPAGRSMNDPEKLRDLLALAEDRDIGVVGMKIVGSGRIFEYNITLEEAMNYALSLPIATANVGISSPEFLEADVRAAKQFKRYDEGTMAELEKRARAR